LPVKAKVAVVTGGSSGIGAAIARTLARRGWRLVLLARGEERLREVAREVGAEHEVCDVADRAEVDRVAAAVRERHPAIRLLVNNAGIAGRGGFLDLEPEQIEQLVRTNYLGSVWCLRAFLPALEAGAPADVVNIASVAGTIAAGHSGPYSASKHAQIAFSRSVGVELAGSGVTVHTINPGFIDTPGFPNRSRFRNRLLGSDLSSSPISSPSASLAPWSETGSSSSCRAGTGPPRSSRPPPRRRLPAWPALATIGADRSRIGSSGVIGTHRRGRTRRGLPSRAAGLPAQSRAKRA
jgi:uncharacterized protein